MSDFVEVIETPEGMGMSIIKYRYIGEGPENDALVAEVLARENKAREARRAIIEEHGADGMILSFWETGKPEQLYYKERQNRPYLKAETHHVTGEWSYKPKLTTKEGKRLQEQLKDPAVVFAFDRYIVEKLDLYREEYGGGRIAWSTAGIANGKIVVTIPGMQGDTPPTVPAWMREVTESEYQNAIRTEEDNEE